jgi:hypothetical protein
VVHRRGGEVPLLRARLVAEVRSFLGAGVPLPLHRVDSIEAAVGRGLEAHIVEDEELRLGSEVGGVGHPGGEQVLLRLLGDVARVAAVALTGDRVSHVAVHDERLPGAERIEVRGVRIRDQDHVRFLDLLEPADRRAVEGVAVLELALVEHRSRDRHVLHHPRQVAEPQVDELDVLRLDQLEHLVRGSLFHGVEPYASEDRSGAERSDARSRRFDAARAPRRAPSPLDSDGYCARAPQIVSMRTWVVSYGSQLALGRRSSM